MGRLSPVAAREGCSLIAECRFLIAVASLVEHGLYGAQASAFAVPELSSCHSRAVECRLSSFGE